MKKLLFFSIIFSALASAFGQSPDPISKNKMNENLNTGVLELRNYLLKPGTTDRFRSLFNERFVEPMNELGGHTIGQFRLKGDDDHFVWMRSFQNMQTRLNFLNAFYLNSPIWKQYKADANGMIINSDNVYLLRPLNDRNEAIPQRQIGKEKVVVIVDFYVCNSTLDKTIALFKKDYLPYLKTLDVNDVSLWVSELSENEFPRLPAFQDKNLLVSMTVFKNEQEAESKLKKIDSPGAELDLAMKELITTRSRLVLYSTLL